MRRHLRLGSRLTWTLAIALAMAAPVVYLVRPGDLTWWLAPLLALPLVFLAEWRRERTGYFPDCATGGTDGGGWSPPADHPGGF